MRESEYQSRLIKRLKREFPGAIVLKNDPNYLQGVPDLILLWHQHWATLEVKARATASRRPNQSYWVETMNAMSYSAFIFPENESDVINDLRQALGA